MKPSSLPMVAIGAALVAVLVMFGIVMSWRGDIPAETTTTSAVPAADPSGAATPTPDVIAPDPFADSDSSGTSGTSDSSSSTPFEGFATDDDETTAAATGASGGASAEGLNLSVSGSCTKDGGTLTGEGSGFTPRKRYVLVILQPDGSYWPDAAGARIHKDGTFPWQFDCQGADPGLWTAVLTDAATGRKLTAGFTVGA